jgi:DNA-binding NtrC family response regulator
MFPTLETGYFWADLCYRFNVFPLRPPAPLPREARRTAHATIEPLSIDRRALEAWQSAPWPGNTRQLENEVERAVIIESDSLLRVPESHPIPSPSRVSANVRTELQSRERLAIEAALIYDQRQSCGPGRRGSSARIEAVYTRVPHP